MIIFVKFRHAQCPGRFLATHELRVRVDIEPLDKKSILEMVVLVTQNIVGRGLFMIQSKER